LQLCQTFIYDIRIHARDGMGTHRFRNVHRNGYDRDGHGDRDDHGEYVCYSETACNDLHDHNRDHSHDQIHDDHDDGRNHVHNGALFHDDDQLNDHNLKYELNTE